MAKGLELLGMFVIAVDLLLNILNLWIPNYYLQVSYVLVRGGLLKNIFCKADYTLFLENI